MAGRLTASECELSDEKPRSTGQPRWAFIGVGVAIGLAYSLAFDNYAMGLPLGIAIGVALALSFSER